MVKRRTLKRRSRKGGFWNNTVDISPAANKVAKGMNNAAEGLKNRVGQLFGTVEKGLKAAPGDIGKLGNKVKGMGVKAKSAGLERANSVKNDLQTAYTAAMKKMDGIKDKTKKTKKTKGGKIKSRSTRKHRRHRRKH